MTGSDGAQVGRIPPPVYFAGGLVAGLLADRVAPMRLPGGAGRRLAGAALVAAGGAVCAGAARGMISRHTTLVPHEPVTALVTTGLHARSRNPIYTGFAAAYVGVSLLAGSWCPLLGLPAVLGLVRRRVIDPEEAYLAERFPVEYADYRSRVRRWL